jgi:hypothetical protein
MRWLPSSQWGHFSMSYSQEAALRLIHPIHHPTMPIVIVGFADAIEARSIHEDDIPSHLKDAVMEELLSRWIMRNQEEES